MSNNRRWLMFLILAGMTNILTAQATVNLSFFPTYQNSPLVLEETIAEDKLQIQTFKCYISQIEFYQEGEKVFSEENSYHLLNMEAENSLSFSINFPENITFSNIKFKIGIDSLTNVSGAFGGDLDPTNGMYWTWQSGYINFKLEGVAEDCPARLSRFQFHVGGYRMPYSSLQTIDLETSSKDIKINIAIDKLLAKIDLKETYQIMSPDEESVKIAQLFASIFSISNSKLKTQN